MKNEQNFKQALASQQIEWINLINPSHDEVERLSKLHDLDYQAIISALDEEERSRVEFEDNYMMIIVDVPVSYDEDTYYSTVPLGIIKTNQTLITLCTKQLNVFNKRRLPTNSHINAYIYQILYNISILYLGYLRIIERKSTKVEKTLREAMKNEILFEMLDLQKSLVYMSSSLKSNQIVLERLLRIERRDTFEHDLLEDVIVENRQAIDMSKIYSNILNSNVDVFSNVISNNLNIVMKFLTIVSVIIAVPTVVSSFWGMNVPVPFQDSVHGFLIVSIVALIITIIAGIYINTRQTTHQRRKKKK
ncbi:MAG TPA: magnesium transporter [Firmicutes bacterium]|nr:magnesium transporter [Bacillota bacterium]